MAFPDLQGWTGSIVTSSGSLILLALSSDDWIAKILVRYKSNVISFWDSVIWTLAFSLRVHRIEEITVVFETMPSLKDSTDSSSSLRSAILPSSAGRTDNPDSPELAICSPEGNPDWSDSAKVLVDLDA